MGENAGEFARAHSTHNAPPPPPEKFKTPSRSPQYPGSSPQGLQPPGATLGRGSPDSRWRAQHLNQPAGPAARSEGGPGRASARPPAESRPARPQRVNDFREEAGGNGVGRAGLRAILGGVRRARDGREGAGAAEGAGRRTAAKGMARREPPLCSRGLRPRQGLRGAASGRAGPYRTAAAGRRGAPMPAWPPEPGVPRPHGSALCDAAHSGAPSTAGDS